MSLKTPDEHTFVSIRLVDKDNSCHFFDIEYNGKVLSISCFLNIEGEILYLNDVDIEGPGPAFYGSELKSIITKIGNAFCTLYNTKSVLFSGARRTTGKYKGKIPRPIEIKRLF